MYNFLKFNFTNKSIIQYKIIEYKIVNNINCSTLIIYKRNY